MTFHGVQRFGRQWRLVCCGLLLVVCSCDEERARAPLASADFEIEKVDLPASFVTAGFKTGRLRMDVAVEGYQIAKRPVTRAEFQACTKAGVCSAQQIYLDGTPAVFEPGSEEPIEDIVEDQDEPAEDATLHDMALGVTPANAAAFCRWVGGKLPTLSQWLLAARGPSVQRYAWGDQLPGCAQHPGGVQTSSEDGSTSPAERARLARTGTSCGNTVTRRYRVGLHSDGASSTGVEDVLLAPAEMLRRDPENMFSACRGKDGSCSVYGAIPGAIDFVRPAALPPSDPQATPAEPASTREGFRCVWGEES